jgi:hypothetical protein
MLATNWWCVEGGYLALSRSVHQLGVEHAVVEVEHMEVSDLILFLSCTQSVEESLLREME